MKKELGKKTFLKMLSFYLFIFIAIFLIFASVILFQAIAKNKEKETGNIEYLFHTASQRLNETLNLVGKINTTLYIDPVFGQFTLRNNVDRAKTVISELNKVAYYNPSIYEIFYYPGLDGYLYSTKSSYTIARFDSTFHYEDWSFNDMFLKSMTSEQIVFRPIEEVTDQNFNKHNNFLTIVLPNRSLYLSRMTVVMIKEQTLKTQLSAVLREDATTLVLDRENQVLFSSNEKEITKQLVSKLNFQTEHQTISVGKKRYHVSQNDENALGIRTVTYIEQKDLFKTLDEITMLYLLFLGLIFVLGVILIIIATRKNYSHVHELSKFFEEESESDVEDEYDLIHCGIEKLKSNYVQLNNEFYSSKQAIKNYLIYSLVKSKITKVEEFNKKGEYFSIKLLHDKFCFIKFNISAGDHIELIENYFPKEILIQLICREDFDTDTVVAICSYSYKAQDYLEDSLKQLQTYLSQCCNKKVKLAVSSSVSDLSKLYIEYINVNLAAEYFSVLPEDIIYYKKIKINKQSDLSFFNELMHEFSSALEKKELKKLQKIIDQAREEIIKQCLSIVSIMTICYSFIGDLVVYMTSNNYSQKSLIMDEILKIDYRNMDQTLSQISAMCNEICNTKEKGKDILKDDTIDQIKQIIEENYLKADFSVQIIALELDMNVSSLSLYFKKKEGVNLIDYITEKKINYVKQRIDTCDALIKDIAQEAGYYNITSFNRRFKQVCGVTPSEYKKMKK